MLPYGVFALFWSPLTRKFNVKNIFLVATLGFAMASLLFSLSRTIHQAFFFRFLMGCFGCGFVPLTLITVGKTIDPKLKSKYIGTFFALSYLSTSLSVFLSGFLSWRIIYFIPAVLSIIILFLVTKHLEDFDFRVKEFKISYLDTFKDKQALPFFVAIVAGSFLYHGLQQWMGVYLHKAYFLPQVFISMIFTVSTVSAGIFEFAGGYLSSHYGNIRITRVGFILMGLFAIILALSHQYQALFFLIIFWGSGWALTHVGLSSHLAHFPDKILRDSSSLNSSLRFFAGGIGAFFGGFMVSLIGFKAHFFLIGVGICILGIFLKKLLNVKEANA
jgi:predicted MFS family arabinose efflux permease